MTQINMSDVCRWVSYLLADVGHPWGGAVAEVGPLGVPVALWAHACVHGHTCVKKEEL